MDTEQEKCDWPKAAVLELIKMWQTFECLYDSKHNLYHNKRSRTAALNQMADTLKAFNPAIGATEIKNKMQYLRGQYTRELAKIKERKRGLDEDDVYVPAAYWFRKLSFLNDYIKVRKSDCNLKDDKSLPPMDSLDSSELLDGETPPAHPVKVARVSNDTPQLNRATITEDSVLTAVTTVLHKIASIIDVPEGNEKVKTFCKYIQVELDEIENVELRDEVMERITMVIIDAKKKRRMAEEKDISPNMPRQGVFDVNEHFIVTEEKIQCRLCDKYYTTYKNSNLRFHLENTHKYVFDQQGAIEVPIAKKLRIKCNVHKETLIRSYIGLLIDEGVSFMALNSAHMKKIIDPICSGIYCEKGKKFRLNVENCKKALAEVARHIVTDISSECENRIISLKFDSCTISAQFMKDSQVVSRVLGIYGSRGPNTGQCIDLASEILNVLRKYNINIKQVVSIITENVRNILKPVKLMSVDDTASSEMEDNYENDIYFQNIEKIVSCRGFKVGDIVVSTCPADIANMVVLDLSRHISLKDYISNCRNLVKLVRCNMNGYKDMFIRASLKIPQLDCPTWWGSTYTMMQDVKNAKDIFKTVKSETNQLSANSFVLIDDFWNFVESYCTALAPLHKAITVFQERHMDYANFYAKWLQCKLMISSEVNGNCGDINSHLYKINKLLLENIKIREKELFANHILPACLYLDPRFHHLLTEEEKKHATSYLYNLWKMLSEIKEPGINAQAKKRVRKPSETQNSDEDVKSAEDDEDDLSPKKKKVDTSITEPPLGDIQIKKEIMDGEEVLDEIADESVPLVNDGVDDNNRLPKKQKKSCDESVGGSRVKDKVGKQRDDVGDIQIKNEIMDGEDVQHEKADDESAPLVNDAVDDNNRLPKKQIESFDESVGNRIMEKVGKQGDDAGDCILSDFLEKQFNANVLSTIEKLKIEFIADISDVVAYWFERKDSDPEMYTLSNICFGMPATQTSTQKVVSSVKLLLSDETVEIDDNANILENLLLVKCHPHYLDKIISELESFFTI